MKIVKKIATLLLALCLTAPCFSMLTYAANGSIQFTDPSTKVGETLEVTGAVKVTGGNIEDTDVTMTYDTSMLKFKNGDNVTESAAGQLTFSIKGTGDGNTHRFKMYFDVLKEGTTKIEVSEYKAFTTSDEKLTCQEGFSTITIAAGEGTSETEPEGTPVTTETTDGMSVTVDEKEYTLSGEFAATDIPEGFVESVMEYNGAQVKVVQQEASGICLGYLVDADNIGGFFLYNTEDATFSPFEQIQISDSTVITVLTNKTQLNLPKEYQRVNLRLNEQDFPAWQNVEKDGFYIIYAINNQGEKSLYQIDTIEGTYQRFETPTVEKEKKDTSLLGKLTTLLNKHLDYVILGTGLGLILFVIIIIVLGVKLHNRNVELDELYDEYDIDVEDEEPVVQAKPEKKGFFKKRDEDEDDFEDDDFEDEDDFEDDDFEDEDEFEDDDFEEEDNFEEDDDFIDFEDDFEEEPVKPVRLEEEPDFSSSFDDFDMDFIDLDD